MATSGRIIILAGAPVEASLNWDETSLCEDLDIAIERFLTEHYQYRQKDDDQDVTQTPRLPKWRSLNIANGSEEHRASRFLAKQKSNPKSKDASPDSQDFLEHSFAFLENLQTSQILPTHPDSITLSSGPSFSTNESTSFLSAATTSHAPPTIATASLNTTLPLTDLHRLPTATHLTSIHPQTMTVNFLAAIIAVSPPRTVSLRRRKGEMEIVELTVGDDTRAGFGVSFWLSPAAQGRQTRSRQREWEQQRPADDLLRARLMELRSGDVVLLSNVALTEFRGKVFGQSLAARRFGGRGTGVDVVDDGGMDPNWGSGFKATLRTVREWRDMFVGRARRADVMVANGIGGAKRKADELLLPPDTQD